MPVLFSPETDMPVLFSLVLSVIPFQGFEQRTAPRLIFF